MSRKKKETLSEEQLVERKLKSELDDLLEKMHLIPDPTKVLEIGDQVNLGNLKDVIIEEILEQGKIYLVNFTFINNNYGNPIESKNQKRYVNWMDVRAKNISKYSNIKNEDLRLNYSQRTIGDILSKAYYFGIDFEPDYQRDYVWGLEDKVELIDSIFNNVDIGKLVYVKIDDEKWRATNYKYSYEILDGKQRIRAILDFYEDRFTYNGQLFSDLSVSDVCHFESYSINVAEVSHITEEQALRYFLKLNRTGKTMDKAHLQKVEDRLNKLIQ